MKQATIAGLGIAAWPGYVCKAEVRVGTLRRILPDWVAGESTLRALVPHRQGMLPAVRAFVDYLAAELPKVINLDAPG